LAVILLAEVKAAKNPPRMRYGGYGFKPNTVRPLPTPRDVEIPRALATAEAGDIEAEEDIPGFQGGLANVRRAPVIGTRVESGGIGNDNFASFMHGLGGIEGADEVLASVNQNVDLDTAIGGIDGAPLEASDFDTLDSMLENNEDSVVAFTGPSQQDLALQKKLMLAIHHLKTAHTKVADLRRKCKRSQGEARLLEETLDDERHHFADERLGWEAEKAQLKLAQKSNLAHPLVASNTKQAIAERELKRKRREEARRKLLFAGDGGDGSQEMEELELEDLQGPTALLRNLWRRCKIWLSRHYPLNGDLKFIKARYGNSVASYFEFSRWIIVSVVLCTSAMAPLLGYHVLDIVDDPDARRREKLWTTVGPLPWVLQFSSYSTAEATAYSSMLICLFAVLLLQTVRKWVAEDRQADLYRDVSKYRNYSFM
jgi:hypothetical protein